MLRRTFVALFALAVFFSLSAFVLYKAKPQTYHRYESKIASFLNKESNAKKNKVTLVEAAPDLQPVFSKAELKRDLIFLHRIAARSNGVKNIDSKTDLVAFVTSEKLVPVGDDIGYKLAEMSHSYAFLTPNAKTALQKIGVSFSHFSKNNSYFTVSSLTRTEETQKKLQKTNRNATREGSTHCHGVSFDISYIRYNGKREWNDKLTKVLEGVLAAMQEDNEIYVVKESKQSCFHITVRD